MEKQQNVYSYSRLNLYQQCPRRFYLKYIEKMQEPASEPAELGKAVHRFIELAVSGELYPMPIVLEEAALPLKEDDILKLANHYLKKHQASPSQRYEGHVVHQIGSRGALFQGYIDMLDQSGLTPLITDFKSNRVSYEPNDSMQLRMYAWLIHKKHGYEEVNARLWFLREAYKRCERSATYTQADFDEAEQWATQIIDEIETNLGSVYMGFTEPLESFAPKHGHACTHCPFAKHCRPDLLELPDVVSHETAEEVASKVLVLERMLEEAKVQLKEFASEKGHLVVGDEEFGFRPAERWTFPPIDTMKALRGLGEVPFKYMTMSNDSIKKLMDKRPEAQILKEVGNVTVSHSFVHKKAGDIA